MDWLVRKDMVVEWTKRYRWILLVILVGLFLLTLPKKKTEEGAQTPVTQEQKETTLQQNLEDILSRVDGAGKVRVLLTISSGEEIHFQMDEESDYTSDSSDVRRETVLVSGVSREQSGLIQRIDPPKYLGAVILSQGADRATVRLALVEAVKTATGLTADKISVLKMK